MRQQTYSKQRINRAWRVAYYPDCQRIKSTPVMREVCHAWAREILDDLSSPATKVLSYLAALNRTGTTGYVGMSAAYQLLAPEIGKATQSKFSRRSLERAVRDLKDAGLIDVQPWIREGQQFKAGGKNVRMCHAGTVTLSGGRVLVRRLAIVTLTEQGLAMWDAPRPGYRTKTYTVRKEPSTAKLAVSSPCTDQCDNTHELEPHSVSLSKSELDTVVEVQGRSTRPPARASRETVEHKALTGDLKLKRGPTAHMTTTRASNDTESPCPDASEPLSKGCSKPRPACRGTHTTYCSSIVRESMLMVIWDLVANHSSREATAVFARARWELKQDGPHPHATTVDWGYWATVWPNLNRAEKVNIARRQFLKPLKGQRPIVPIDRKRLTSAEGPKTRPGGKSKIEKQNSWLLNVATRMGIGNRFSE